MTCLLLLVAKLALVANDGIKPIRPVSLPNLSSFVGIKMRQAVFSLRFSVLPSLLLQSQSAESPPIARPNRCIASCCLTLEEKETPSPRSVHHHNGPFSHPSGYCLARLLQVRLPLQRWGEDCYCTVSMGTSSDKTINLGVSQFPTPG